MNDLDEQPIERPAWLTLADLQSVAARKRRLLLTSGLAGLVVGALYVAFAEQRYESSIVVRPVLAPSQAGGGLPLGLGALATQFGMGGSDASPYFIASILESRDLAVEVLESPVPSGLCPEGGANGWDCLGLEDRMDAAEQATVIEGLRKSMSVNVDPLAGTLHVSVRASTGELAEHFARTFAAVTNAKLTSLNQQQSEAEQRYLLTQISEYGDSLAQAERSLKSFLQANRSTGSPDLMFEERRLQGRWTFFNGVVESLLERAQAARLSEVRDTPVLAVVDSSEVPARPAWPRPVLVLLGATFASVLAGYVYALAGTARTALRE